MEKRLDQAGNDISKEEKKEGGAKKDKETKKKSKKNEAGAKGPDHVKRPLSAYMLYNNHRRPVLKGEHPCKNWRLTSLVMNLTEVSKLIGEEWQKLSEDQKRVSSKI